MTSYKGERERVMFVVLHYPLGTVRQQLSQDHVLQGRERESYVRGTALSTRHCQTIAQPGWRPTSERERERERYVCGTALSTRHCQTTAQPGWRPTSERERERDMFVVLHYPLGTVRQQLSQDDVLQARERERERYVCGTALSTRHCQTTAQPGSRPTSERERERDMFVVLHYPLGTVRQQLSQDHVLQERERERERYVCGTALSTRHCQTTAQPGSHPTRERELCSWYCTIHSALSDNSSARITSYKRERESYVRGTALSSRHCQTTAQPGSRPISERERVMFVVLHYPVGTVRQQLSQDHVL